MCVYLAYIFTPACVYIILLYFIVWLEQCFIDSPITFCSISLKLMLMTYAPLDSLSLSFLSALYTGFRYF